MIESDFQGDIKRLKNKANLNREIRAHLFRRYDRLNKAISTITIVGSVTIAIISMALYGSSLGEIFLFYVCFLGIIISTLVVIERIWDFRKKSYEENDAMNRLTDFSWECDMMLRKDINEEDLHTIKDKYVALTNALPGSGISDVLFLKIKKSFLVKVELSKRLDSDPSLNVKREYKKLMKNK